MHKASRDWAFRPSPAAGGGLPARLQLPLLAIALAGLAAFPIARAERSDKWWWDYGGGPDSSHFVELDQIKKSNVSKLEVAWFYPHGATGFNPVVVDDVMYVLGRNGQALIALDATTGKEIWIHDGLTGIITRGINYWQSQDGKDRRLLFSINGYLQAIDARTGKSILSFGTNGFVNLRDGLRRAEGTDRRVQSRTPGKVWKNLLILGSAAGESWITPPGDIRAYDVVTGKRVWQFHTVPEPGEFGYDTWPKDAYKYVGGANNWGEMSVDEERGIVYVPTGSATYDFYGADRHGMNLFANCLLALDGRTGKRLWHFQTVHHDLWDLDNVSAPQLVTVRHNGRRVDAVAHAGKTGLMYVFNRVTGEPLWPIEEKPVPKSDVPGEQAWPTQPFPTKPPPFAKMTFGIDDVNPWLLSPEQYETMLNRIKNARNEGPFTPPAFIDTVSMPGNQGGSNWGTTAANPKKGLVYVVNVNQVALLKLEDVKTRTGGRGGAAPPGAQAYQQYCQACHGVDFQGVPGLNAPSLVGITERLAEDALRAVVTGGKGTMRPVAGITETELSAVLLFLANPNAAGRGGGRGGRGGRGGGPGGPPLPPGPVVATGGVPLPPAQPVDADPPSYGTNGGNGGNTPYPEDVGVPPARYVSEYGVMASATKPPYTTLTAYDLNTGTIKWQIAPGDDPATVQRGGPTGTGAVGGRYGVVATSAGLVFLAGGDGKVRAYNEENGQVLWTGTLPGPTSGIPVSYEAKGRQYVVIASLPGGFRGGVSGPASSAEAPRGYIAFALPKR
jgi:quinoprotein glucose dehydrogenase